VQRVPNSTTVKTSVFVKPTNHGDCLNYNSMRPERYKVGVIRAFLHRGYNVSDSWQTFHLELERIKQLLTNNNYPMLLIESVFNKFISEKFASTKTTGPPFI